MNGFKKENQERSLGRQLGAVERYLGERSPDRAFAAEVMSICCRDFRYTFTQFKEVYERCEREARAGKPPEPDAGGRPSPSGDVATRSMQSYQEAFDRRCAS